MTVTELSKDTTTRIDVIYRNLRMIGNVAHHFKQSPTATTELGVQEEMRRISDWAEEAISLLPPISKAKD